MKSKPSPRGGSPRSCADVEDAGDIRSARAQADLGLGVSANLIFPPPPEGLRVGPKAREAFEAYCLMGKDRSLRDLARALKRHPSQMGNWSRKYRWGERVAAYDGRIEAERQQAVAAVAKQDAEKWAQRKRDAREMLFTDGARSRETGSTMDKFPLIESKIVKEKYEDGREKLVQIIKPAKWTSRDALRRTERGHAMMLAAIRDEDSTAVVEVKESDVFEDIPYEPPEKEPK